MKILITGGTGFVGSALTKHLLDLGHEVTVLSSRTHLGVHKNDKLQHVIADTTKPGEWQRHVARMDVLVNLAGRSVFNFWTKKYKQEIWNSRILTTKNLISAIEAGKETTVLSCSAAGYYGDGGEDQKHEDAECGQEFLSEVCKEWEREAIAAEEKGARVATMRFGVVLGKGGGAIATMKTPFQLGLGGPIGRGWQWFPWIHLQDLIDAIIFLISNQSLQGAFNFTAPDMVRQKDFAKELGKVLNRPAFFPAPSIAMRLVLGEFGGSLLQGQKVYPKALLDNGFDFTYPELYFALEEILGD